MLIGSSYFATHLPDPGYKPIFGVLFDMIADKELNIYQEGNSLSGAPDVVRRVWQTAADMGYSKYFINSAGSPITDDHLPLLKAGLKIIDVIDIDYTAKGQNFHHTMMDTMDKISAKSLQIVGDVAVKLITG